MKKLKELHLICNAHIDPVWQWDWEEGLGVTVSTFKQAADFCDEYDYVFCHNESILYEYIEKVDPELFARIHKLVRQGKWVIAGGWYLQPDINMPCGEAMVRQIELGRKYFAEKFGARPATAYNFDGFGHSVGLVQILKKCGFDGYIICRPMEEYYHLPENEFIWKGVDGSEVKVARATDENIYTSGFGTALEEIKRKMNHYAGREYALALWGVGNHGGVNSRKDLEDIKKFREETTDFKVIHSTPEKYIAAVSPTLTIDKSLPFFRGAYSSMSSVKQMNSLLESKLFTTEKLCAFAEEKGLYKKNEQAFTEAIKALSCLEFHDCLAGTIVRSAEISSLRKCEYALELLHREFDSAFMAIITKYKKAELETFPIFVWNGQPYARETIAETEILLPKPLTSDSEEYVATAYLGDKKIPSQTVVEEGSINFDRRKRIAYKFTARPFSVERIDVKFDIKPKHSLRAENGDFVYEDKYKSLRISRLTGLLESYRVDGKELISGGAFAPVMFDDNADPWGWDMVRIGTNPKEFRLSDCKNGVFAGRKNVNIVEDGDVLTEIESFFELGSSFVKVSYRIYKDTPYIDVNYYVLWNEQERALKIQIPTTLDGDFFGQIMFGEETFTKGGEEYVAQRFTGIKDGENALTLYNKGVYSFACEQNTMQATLLRGVAYCAHPIDKRPILFRDRFTPYIEQGRHEFSFRFGYNELSELENNAQEFLNGDYSLSFFPHGDGYDFSGGVEINTKVVSLVSLYRDGDGYTLRLINNNGQEECAEFTVFGVKTKAKFGKFEVKTFELKNGKIKEKELWV